MFKQGPGLVLEGFGAQEMHGRATEPFDGLVGAEPICDRLSSLFGLPTGARAEQLAPKREFTRGAGRVGTTTDPDADGQRRAAQPSPAVVGG